MSEAPEHAVTPRQWAVLGVISAAGTLLRLVHLLTANAGVGFVFDGSVYYASAGAMLAGYRPYGDFVLVQPPGLLFILSPFAWLGEHVIGHAAALAAASAASGIAGGVTIMGLGILATRWRGPRAGVTAALAYAGFLPAILSESDLLLEPFVNVLFIGAAAVWLGPRRAPDRRAVLVTAVIVASSIIVKLTGGVAALACLAAGPFRRPVVDRVLFCVIVAAAALVLVFPFALAAGPGPVLEQTVLGQLGRPRGGPDPIDPSVPDDIADLSSRIVNMLGVGPLGLPTAADPNGGAPLALPLALIGLGLCVFVWRRGGRSGRFWAASWAASAASLVVAPIYYPHYALTLMVSTSMLIGATTAAILDRIGPRVAGLRLAITIFVAPTFAVVLIGELMNVPKIDAGAAIRASVPAASCVYADPPSLSLMAGRRPLAGADRPLVDPFGEPLLIAGRESRSYRSVQEALWSSAAQARVRQGLLSCPYVALVGPIERKRYFSPETRSWFTDHFETIVEPGRHSVGLWRRR